MVAKLPEQIISSPTQQKVGKGEQKMNSKMKLALLEELLQNDIDFECIMDDNGEVDYDLITLIVGNDVPLRHYSKIYYDMADGSRYVDKWEVAHQVVSNHIKMMDEFYENEDEILSNDIQQMIGKGE